MRYEDFSILFGPPRDGEYEVIVARSPAGQTRGAFRIPFDEDELRRLQERLGRFVRASGVTVLSDARSDGDSWTPPPDPREVGGRLFQALFAGDVERLLERSLARVEGEGRGLRILLHLPADRQGFARLAGLPWEVLFWPERGRFLALGRELSVVRFLEIDQPPHAPRLEPPLRILAVASRAGTPPLNVEEELQRLEGACAGLSQVRVTRLPEATPNALRRMLRSGGFHVLHFMGHGAFNHGTGEGALLFEREGGGTDPLPAAALADLLRNVPSLRLVLLTACDSARLPAGEGLDAYGGVAAALLAAGLPAVVAMQYRVSDKAAILFSEAFYSRLAAGDPVDAATAEGRLAVRVGDARSVEWATPVLFLRAPDGHLFAPRPEAGRERTGTADSTAPLWLPPQPSLFVGREDAMAEVKRRLGVATGSGRPVAVVRGWPGVGKTTLVHAVAHDPEILAAFPDGLLWVPLGEAPNVVSELSAWGRRLGLPPPPAAAGPGLGELIGRLRSQLAPRLTLLIVDDVWRAADAIPFKQIAGPSCRLLVTTRFRDVGRELADLPETDVYTLDVLAGDKGLELLALLAPGVVRAHCEECRRLVGDLEGLPLALRVAGRLLAAEAELGLDIHPLLAELRGSHRLLDEVAPDDRFDPRTGTTPTLDLLFHRSTDRLDPVSRGRFARLGVMAPKPATFDLGALAAIWDVRDPRPTVRTLADRGLLEPLGETRFQVHALLALHARTLLGD